MANSNNDTDYTKPHLDLYTSLPEVLQTDTNRSVFRNLFDRFLTKQETKTVAGYIGEGNRNAIQPRQIHESDVHRQAFQLQPILHTKVGSVDHMASWKDIQGELKRSGIDIEEFDKWGKTVQFNWIPPIDIDKAIHYQDYYWVDEESPNSKPEYITIRSRCTTAIANANFWQLLNDEFGSTIPIAQFVTVDDMSDYPSFGVVSVSAALDTIVVAGDATGSLRDNEFFELVDTAHNDGVHQITSSPVYTIGSDSTSIQLSPGSIILDETVGVVNQRKYDKIVLAGDFLRLFDPKFVFFLRESTNIELNDTFWTVVESFHDNIANETTIQINTTTTDNRPSGVISLEEQLNFYLAERDCQCAGSIGWDLLQWDDNPDLPLWDNVPGSTEDPLSHAALLASISQIGPPVGTPTGISLWYDTDADIVYQYQDTPDFTGWNILWNKFSDILSKTKGFALWDFTPGCGVLSVIESADQWVNTNKWLHKSDVPSFSIAKQAQFPIIEYDWDLELNEWSYTETSWKYRRDRFSLFVETDIKPSLIELQPLDKWERQIVGPVEEIVFDERYGDLTETFSAGSKFQSANVPVIFNVVSSVYRSPVVGMPLQTRVIIQEPIAATGLSSGDLSGDRPSLTTLHPYRTANGDAWKAYGDHWLYNGTKDALPITHQPINPETLLPNTLVPVVDPAGFEYIGSYAVEQFTVTTAATVDTFEFHNDLLPGTQRPLNRRALAGTDDIRVYINDIREYGSYNELVDNTIEVVGVTAINAGDVVDSWVLGESVGGRISLGDSITTAENTGFGGNNTYTVIGISGNIVIVDHSATPISNTATGTGVLSNLTTSITTGGSHSYVRGIQFIPGFEPTRFDVLRIEVGEATISGYGNSVVPIRTIIDNLTFATQGNEVTSIIDLRLVEQVKSGVNQYPLFDIYKSDGTAAMRANQLFGYLTSPDAPVNPAVGLRMVADFNQRVFSFDQFLLDSNDGEIFAFRDYSNVTYDYWFNSATNELFFWSGIQWNKKTFMSEFYREAVIGDIEPTLAERAIDGLFWFDTLAKELFIRNTTTSAWDPVSNVDIRTTDNTIQSVWRKGLNNEEYIPAKVDWLKRTQPEYKAEKDLFVVERFEEIVATVNNITVIEAQEQAEREWADSQSHHLSTNGDWIGDWEIPDTLYFNHMHENRKVITSRELLTHFTTIIEAQEKVPGYTGPEEGMFHLIPTGDVNYGLGGTIHEYGDSFDMLLSSVFVNNVTPRTLIEFGHDQYESLLNNLKEIYRDNAISFMIDVSDEAILDFSSFVTDKVITAHATTDFLNVIYGDSSVHNDDTNVGMRNWILTLPYMSLLTKHTPDRLIDRDLGINQVVHHDGHRNDYFLTQATKENIIRSAIAAPDDRTRFPTPEDDPLDTFGRLSTVLPPNNIAEFNFNFNTTVLGREGVYWYRVDGTIRDLYRLSVATAGPDEPSSALADGTLWLDMAGGLEILRMKETNGITGDVDWLPVSGLVIGDGRLHNGSDPTDATTASVSAWVLIDLDIALGDVIFNVEQKLYDNVPNTNFLRYDTSDIRSLNPTVYDSHLRDTFNDHVTQREIKTPLINLDFSSTDPFTWNYKFSTPGVGVGLIDADELTNTFTVSGDMLGLFDPCSQGGFCPSVVSFFVKNSDGNDGTWNTIQSVLGTPAAVYDGVNNVTTLVVQQPVTNGAVGVIYTGILPSSGNDGSESGGDWRDYYQKLYGTPYPHMEPWVLQGYADKPLWWDNQYVNDDTAQWGVRRWKYKHGFEIVGVDIVDDAFFVVGDFRDINTPGQTFTLEDTPSGIYDNSFTVANMSVVTNVNAGAAGAATISIPNNFVPTLSVGTRFLTTDNTSQVTGFFTVKAVVFTGPPSFTTIITVEEEIISGVGIDNISGVVYDPLTNQTKIRVVDDLTVSVFGGRLLQHRGMWENIRIGHIPAGEVYSNGIISVTGIPTTDTSLHNIRTPNIPTYNYFSVNIDNDDVIGGSRVYKSDDVFPPYFDHTIHYTTAVQAFDLMVRSVFTNFSTEIVSPGANYSFGDAGPVEWEWINASQYRYDQLTIAYCLDPMRYVADTFGIDTFNVAGLGIDMSTIQPISHNRITFHGEIVGNTLFEINGTNQWYVNFNRFNGYDANYADFRSLWTSWKAPLTYQFATFVDTPSMDVGHRYVDISEFDYNITSKRAPGIEDHWYDVFDVHVTTIPPALQRYDNQLEWGLEIGTNLDISRKIEHYDVRNYQFYANTTNDVCTVYTWEIREVDSFNKTFKITGDQTRLFVSGGIFIISDSTSNDDTYEVETSTYSVQDNTTIIVVGVVIPGFEIDGTITLLYRDLPWETGDVVYLTTAETLPYPLIEKTSGGLIPYYVIVDDTINFRLAISHQNAILGINLPIITEGRKDHFVGELRSTFISNGGIRTDNLWRHYELDKSSIRTFTTPHDINGMQTLINIIDGYDVLTYDNGWRINEDNKAVDPDTSRPMGWQVEVERFIDYAYGLRVTAHQTVNKYNVSADVGTNVLTLLEPELTWVTGDAVTMFSSNGVFPIPFTRNITYYIIRDTASTIRLASTKNEAKNSNAIDITSVVGVGNLQIGVVRSKDFSRHQEINPTRGAVWFRPERGIVSNIMTGPSPDTRTSNLIFDQNGKPIKGSNLRVFREDRVTKLSIIQDLNPDVKISETNPYTLLHFGGMHLFLDAYEHVLRFNNYTSENALIYDPFIGLNVTKYEMLFNRQLEFTERPNMGGYYMHTFFNQGADLNRNIEASVEDIRNMYNTHNVLESTKITTAGRKSLGYDGTREYLDNLNLHAKSQFLFWKGAIQAKGSLKSVQAFVNSRRFIDAQLDDFWAFKLADFGSSSEKEYPELFITTEDAKSNDIRLQFVDDTDFCNPGYDRNAFDNNECGFAFPDTGEAVLLADPSFTPVRITDSDRWFNQPDQLSTLRNNGLNMHFELKPTSKTNIFISDLTPMQVTGTSTTTVLSVDYMTYVVSGEHDCQVDSFVAIRASGNPLENVEYRVVRCTVVGSDTHIVVDIAPFTTTGVTAIIFKGPKVGEFTGWVIPDLLPTRQEYKTWNAITSTWEHHGEWTSDIADANTPILRHNYASDALVVRVRLRSEGFTHEVLASTGRPAFTLLTVPQYIPHTSGIRVFKRDPLNTNFKQLTVNVDYVESLVPNGSGDVDTLSDTILFREPLLETDTIRVVYVTSELLEDVHYRVINSNIVQIIDQNIFDKTNFPAINNVQVWGLSTDEDAQNPARLVDKISHTAITPVQIWDPARGNHYTNAIHNIDLQNDYDPARYNNTPHVQTLLPDQIYAIDPWTDRAVGTTWLDTTELAYYPYFDKRVFPETEARLRLWGQLNDWGIVKAYEWVKSNVPPSEWDSLAIVEEGDVTIPEGDRKSGTAKLTLFEDDGTASGTWIELKPQEQEFDVLIDGTDNLDGTYDFIVTNFIVGDVVNVYISGKLSLADYKLTTLTLTIESTIFNRITVRKPIPTDRVVIDEGVAAGLFLEDYQYVQIDKRDEFGNEFQEYFFWVHDKGTKPDNKTRSDTLRGVENTLRTIPVPYMFFQELKPPTSIEIEGSKLLSRIEQHTTTISQTSIVTELPIAPDTLVVVSIDGVPIQQANVSYVDGDRLVSFPSSVQPGGQLLEVVYTGLYDETVKLPSRFVQMVSRGLRGVIDADRRYVLRYTRDFTLRDTLDDGQTPLMKKNLHAEWEMFRQHQPYHINRILWDKITESIIGYKLTDTTIRVPSFERELYDDKHDTSTQYGIGDGQAFVSGVLALASVLADLQNPDNSFQPIDINVFFGRHNFDTPEAVILSMDTIYNTYSFEHVNRIFFSVLQDAMSTQSEYVDIMKTSMVSLHGVRPFQISGIFDD